MKGPEYMTIHLPWRHVSLDTASGGRMSGPGIWTSLLQEEAEALAEFAYDNDVLDIGTAAGFSSCAMAPGARSIITVDLPVAWGTGQDQVDFNFQSYGVSNVTRYYESSETLLPRFIEEETKFGFIFIDGDHSEAMLRNDFLNSVQLITSPGIIAVHDYLEDCCQDVKPTMDNVFPDGPDEIIGTMAVYRF